MDVEIIGVPLDLGASMRGCNMGPDAIRSAGLNEKLRELGHSVKDQGNVAIPARDAMSQDEEHAKYLLTILSLCETLRKQVKQALTQKKFPLSIGGDHSLAMGTIAGVSEFYKDQGGVGLIWMDAHADCNTPKSSPSGNIHGMPLAVTLGAGPEKLVQLGGYAPKVDPSKVALIGIRDIDEKERQFLVDSSVRYFTMREIDERGMQAIMGEAISVASNDTAGIHLSFDIDGVDPVYAPGVGTAVPGGMNYRETHLAMEMIADTGKLTSMEFVELNPMRDVNNQTGELTVEFILSALGKSIV